MVTELDAAVAAARRRRARLGFFAARYRQTTRAVRDQIDTLHDDFTRINAVPGSSMPRVRICIGLFALGRVTLPPP